MTMTLGGETACGTDCVTAGHFEKNVLASHCSINSEVICLDQYSTRKASAFDWVALTAMTLRATIRGGSIREDQRRV